MPEMPATDVVILNMCTCLKCESVLVFVFHSRRNPSRQPKYSTAVQSIFFFLFLMESAATDSTHPLAVAFQGIYTEFVTATVRTFRIVSLVFYI